MLGIIYLWMLCAYIHAFDKTVFKCHCYIYISLCLCQSKSYNLSRFPWLLIKKQCNKQMEKFMMFKKKSPVLTSWEFWAFYSLCSSVAVSFVFINYKLLSIFQNTQIFQYREIQKDKMRSQQGIFILLFSNLQSWTCIYEN